MLQNRNSVAVSLRFSCSIGFSPLQVATSDRHIQLDSHDFQPGFRFSLLDFVVLILAIFVGGDLAAVMFWPGIAILFVVAHFFLFCNVVRMSRPSELMWAGLFVALMTATMLAGVPTWLVTFAISLAATLLLVALEVRKPSYHGVFWRQLNPRLPEWWKAKQG